MWLVLLIRASHHHPGNISLEPSTTHTIRVRGISFLLLIPFKGEALDYF